MTERDFSRCLKTAVRRFQRAEDASLWRKDNRFLLVAEGRTILKEEKTLRRLPDRGEKLLTFAEELVSSASAPLDGAFFKGKAGALSAAELERFPLALTGCLLLGALSETEDEVAKCVGTLRAGLPNEEAYRHFCPLDTALCEDGAYRQSDALTRAAIRKKVARLGGNETETAARLIRENALYRGKEGRPLARFFYRAAVILLPLAACLLTRSWLFKAACFLPLLSFFHPLVDTVTLSLLPPRRLLRLDAERGIPAGSETAVVISCLFTSAREVHELFDRLRRFSLADRDEKLIFGLLADFPDAEDAVMPADRAIKQAAEEEMRKCGEEKFFLFLRKRVYAKGENRFAGRERKRGALLDLMKFCRGEKSDAFFRGDSGKLRACRYLLTLDSDTDLPLAGATELVCIASHPANTPTVLNGRVKTGHAVFAPRVVTSLSSAEQSLFARAMNGSGGAAAYSSPVGDVYQDLWGSGLYAGKGLLHIDACLACLPSSLPDGKILSHDIPEGLLLRCAAVTDAEWTDSCPATPTGWLKRLHRWTRGDTQNLCLLFSRRFTRFDKGVLFGAFLRAAIPVLCFALLLVTPFLSMRDAAWLLAVSLLSLFAGEVWTLVFSLLRFLTSKSRLAGTSPAASALLRVGVKLLLLPAHVWTLCSAIGVSLCRLVTKKHLLLWQAAAQSDKSGSTGTKSGAFALFYGVLLFLLPVKNHLLLPLLCVWLLCPLLDRTGKKREPQKTALSDADRDTLTHYAAASWRFFEETATEERGFLPPDNVQETPVPDTAERTSPTNIGLFLLSVVAAHDLDFLSAKTMTDLLLAAVGTIETLDKKNGNLWNWYDLRDRSVLSPYLSSVDSGNFLCCLIALKGAVKDCLHEDRRLFELLPRLEKLIESTDLSVFVDREREKLVTGLSETGEKSRSAYDLLMSEALLTLYAGVARGEIPLAVFRSLGRPCGKKGKETGILSWTGTMFEYFMPTLLLPVFRRSAIDRSLRFALACQKAKGDVWGISESAFYGFDSSLHYGYRAHGVQSAALCRGQDADFVVSPYSSFLALPFDKKGALENLLKLRRKGMWGEYGFYDALDKTASRTGGGSVPVRSFMAHHVGMSLVATANVLNDNVFVRRFLDDPCIAAAQGLLAEKLPDAVPLYRGYDEVRGKKPPRLRLSETEVDAPTPLCPRGFLLAGKNLTLTLSDGGIGQLKKGDVAVTSTPVDPLLFPTGLFCLLRAKGQTVSLFQAPLYDTDPTKFCRQVKVTAGSITAFVHTADCDAALSFLLDPDADTGSVTLTVKNLTASPLPLSALLYTEPMLCLSSAELSHRAFEKLFLDVERFPDGAVFFRRKGRGEALSLAVCRKEHGFITRCFDREDLLRRPDGVKSLKDAFGRDVFRDPAADLSDRRPFDLCAASCVNFRLPPKGEKSLCYAFAVSADRDDALEKARARLRKNSREAFLAASAAKRTRMGSAHLDRLGIALCDRLLPRLLFPSPPAAETKDAVAVISDAENERLWRLGISGDLPLITVRLGDRDRERVRAFAAAHRYLSLCGIRSDLVFLVKNRHEYGDPVTAAVKTVLAEQELLWSLGKKGGIFCIDVSDDADADRLLVARSACHSEKDFPVEEKASPALLLPVFPVSGEPTPARRPWCRLLANDCFGTLVSDRALGHSFALSSKENRLTPWTNDTSHDLTGEELFLDIAGKRFRMTDGATVEFFPDRVCYRGRAAGVTFCVTVSLAGKLPVKKIEVTLSAAKETEVSLSFFGVPAFIAGRLPLVRTTGNLTERLNGRLFAGVSFLSCSVPSVFTFDAAKFLTGDESAESPYPCFAQTAHLTVKEETAVTFFLGWSGTKEGARRMEILLQNGKYLPADPVTVKKTGDRFVDEELPSQILSYRLRGRTGFYQSAGGYGFRDQLQDAANIVPFAPKLARQQILRAACRQFERGDVFHWWVDRGSKPPFGSRTTCSDDLLWLPYAVERYLSVTNDRGILDVETPFLIGELPETEVCFEASCGKKATVTEHCLRAISRADRRGEHGLVKIGLCDWNDALQIGARDRGETVWGTQFLSLVCRRFAPVCGDETLLKKADELDEAWLSQFEGDRFIRAYDDFGNALGRKGNKEMALDILPQSFAAILRPDDERSQIALDTVLRELWDEKAGVLKLFAPPFREGAPVGYLAAYPEGVRENGGQYTHAAVWFLFALCRAGRKDEARRIAERLRPDKKDPAHYRGEPFLFAGDVDLNGVAGWTGYTGAAGWMYRLWTEEL